jgi:hypothetical protein
MENQISISINELLSLFNGVSKQRSWTMALILERLDENGGSPLLGKYAVFNGGFDGVITRVSLADDMSIFPKVTIEKLNEDRDVCLEVHPVRDIDYVKEITDVDKKLFLSTTPVKDILNREFLKFKLPKEGQEVNIRIHFRENEDVESDTGWIDAKVYKLHGAFCVSLEYDGHEIIGEVFESGQKAVSEIYKEMAEIIDEWELGDCIANSVEDATYGWMHH